MHQGMAALSPRPHWGNPPPSTTRAAEYLYIHVDHLNTPQVVTDVNQRVAWKGDNKPFGDVEAAVEIVEMNLRFPGQYYDQETGLNYNYFRSYDASTGRYTQSDPVGLLGGLNSYIYAVGRPILGYDPRGLRVKWTGSTFSGGATAVIGGQLTAYEFTSECKCGQVITLRGFASFLTYGGGVKGVGQLSGSTSSAELFTNRDCPNASDFNGSAWSSGIGLVFGFGGTLFPSLRLGSASSDPLFGSGPNAGLDISATSTLIGWSAVTDVKKKTCCGD